MFFFNFFNSFNIIENESQTLEGADENINKNDEPQGIITPLHLRTISDCVSLNLETEKNENDYEEAGCSSECKTSG